MATTRFDVKEGLTIVLPPAAKEGAQVVQLSEKDMTRIFVTNNGDIMWNKENIGKFNQTVLDGRIKKILSTNAKMIFTIKTDREAAYNDMVKVLDRLKASGAEKISLSTN
jgi:biopolymer transport protein ExbD